ncbi:hypothetical protein GGH96_000868 [Coemansia sp. RSA 1972]|nr:hypothetical protein GGH96_000868 [Coemansia sp. RSA 1972]
MKTICTVGAIAAMLVSACLGQDADRVDGAVAEARAMRHEQCGRLDHTSLAYNQCMARWTDRVLECFPETLNARQEADKMTELGRADAYHNAVERQLHANEHRRNAWTGASEDNASENHVEAVQRVQDVRAIGLARGAGKQAPVRQATGPVGNREAVDSGDQANAAPVAMPIAAQVPKSVIHLQAPKSAGPETSNVSSNKDISQSVQPAAEAPVPTAANMVQAPAVNSTVPVTEAKQMSSGLAGAQSVGQAVSATAGALSLVTASTATQTQQLDATPATVTVTTPVQMVDASQVFPIQTFIAQTVISPSPVAQASAAKEAVQTTVAQALVSQSPGTQASVAKETVAQASVAQASAVKETVVQASAAKETIVHTSVAKETVVQASVVQETVAQAPGVQTLATQASVAQASASPASAQKSLSSQDQPLTTMVAAEIEVPQLVTIKVVTHTIEAVPTMINSIHMTTFGNAVVPWDVNLFGTDSAVALSAETTAEASAESAETSVAAESVTVNSESGVVAESVTFNAESASDARSASSVSAQAVSATAPAALTHAQATQSPVDAVRALGVVDATEAAAKIARAGMKNKETNASTKLTVSTAAVIVPAIFNFLF